MRARATVVAERRGDCSRCTTLRCAPPLTFRVTPAGLHLIGSAAGPVGGDDLALELTISRGASLTVRSVAAQLVLPAPTPAPSTMHVSVEVGEGASLTWEPQPTVLVQGADHRLSTTIDVAPGADLVWRDEVVLGREGEPGGSLLSRLRVVRAGRPLLCTEVALGPAWPTSDGPAGVGDARVVASTLLVGAPAQGALERHAEEACRGTGPGRRTGFALADDAVLLSVLVPGVDAARRVGGHGSRPRRLPPMVETAEQLTPEPVTTRSGLGRRQDGGPG